ncbi:MULTISPECIES: hypothetical protein [unclassified Methylobacterium]|uniref:hypothetical protein n=1 Tax=unclassified Methylobacterium TaxID=2615210 RepID=UPI0006F5DA31|nr:MULTISPECIES: hypothetical protein [unclassified Methylobacterium]KQP77612.1 hypothetical protein ASF60_06435 [Methylobacterium sp. Leaf113]KQP83134.1 hypothetical protein ASF57_13665 [Methylobacterium sp. Leaf117]MCK2055029.1 hypothetical protein [Methylobacterium sp. 37f]
MRRGSVAIRRGGPVLVLLAGLAPIPAGAADFGGLAYPTPGRALDGAPAEPEGLPRYFPRAEEDGGVVHRGPVPRRRLAGCIPRRVPIPTDAPGDPSYVGSAYGLGKPSYYGFTPPLGIDDPYGRPLRPYCP